MTDRLVAFFSRLDDVIVEADGGAVPTDLVDDDAVGRRGEALRPVWERRAERAGVTLDTLLEIIREDVQLTAQTIALRLEEDDDRDTGTELELLAATAGMHYFLAGAMWEQERHLPEIET